MTTLFEEHDTCTVCQQTTRFMAVGSTNAFGSPDLDLRPPPMERDLLPQAVPQCPHCGFCARQLLDSQGLETRLVGSEEYKATLQDSSFPPLACKFRAMALLAGAAGNTKGAGHALRNAAWACDDAGEDYKAGAAECRLELLAALDDLHAASESLTNDETTDAVLRLDLLRRSGDFTGVEEAAEAVLDRELSELLAQIVAFQRQKARERDSARYTVKAAIS